MITIRTKLKEIYVRDNVSKNVKIRPNSQSGFSIFVNDEKFLPATGNFKTYNDAKRVYNSILVAEECGRSVIDVKL